MEHFTRTVKNTTTNT